MNEDEKADLIARKLGRVSDLVSISAVPGNVDGTLLFHLMANRILTTDEMISICRDMAAVIRRERPERPDGWAASIVAEQYGTGDRMGDYSIGWAGRADQWRLREGQGWSAADRADWLALIERLRVVLIALGRTEATGIDSDSDFSLERTEDGRRHVVLFTRQPEFLTHELIAAIQNVLKHGYAGWKVDLAPEFSPPFDKLFRGIDVRANDIEEKWDRRQVKRLLGDRLKI